MNREQANKIYNSEHGLEWHKIYNSPEFEAQMEEAKAEYPQLSEDDYVAAAENVEHLMDQDGESMDPANWLSLFSASLEGIENDK
jgi:hypothetical protein